MATTTLLSALLFHDLTLRVVIPRGRNDKERHPERSEGSFNLFGVNSPQLAA